MINYVNICYQLGYFYDKNVILVILTCNDFQCLIIYTKFECTYIIKSNNSNEIFLVINAFKKKDYLEF